MQAPAQLPGLIQAVAPIITHYGYFAVGGLLFLEDFGVPVPGETTLIAAAVFAGLGRLNIFVVIAVALVAAVLGDNVGFAIGSFGGRPLLVRFGRYVFLTPERITKAESFFQRHGGKVVVIARFVEGLRQANGIIAGISEMKWLKFVGLNIIGAALWVGFWASVGYFGGNHITIFYKYESYFSAIVATLIIAYVAYYIVRRRNKRRRLKADPKNTKAK